MRSNHCRRFALETRVYGWIADKSLRGQLPRLPEVGVYIVRDVFFLHSFQPAAQRDLGRRAHPVDEKNAVEMIDLVLEGAREQPARFDFDLLAIQRLRA